MSEPMIEETQANALQNIRLDTALRIKGIQKAFDHRDDLVELLMNVSVALSNGIEDAKAAAISTENCDVAAILVILNNAQLKAKEFTDRANADHS